MLIIITPHLRNSNNNFLFFPKSANTAKQQCYNNTKKYKIAKKCEESSITIYHVLR